MSLASWRSWNSRSNFRFYLGFSPEGVAPAFPIHSGGRFQLQLVYPDRYRQGQLQSDCLFCCPDFPGRAMRALDERGSFGGWRGRIQGVARQGGGHRVAGGSGRPIGPLSPDGLCRAHGRAEVYPRQKNKLPPGSYRARYREGIKLVYDSDLLLPNKEKWINPTGLQISDKGMYVLDSGKVPPAKKTGDPAPDAPPEDDPTNQSYIFKFSKDGKPDISFGDRGRIAPFPKATGMRAFAVNKEPLNNKLYNLGNVAQPPPAVYRGKPQPGPAVPHIKLVNVIYFQALRKARSISGSGSHNVNILSAAGDLIQQTIGGWDSDPHGPKCTVWVNSLALGTDHRIYIPNGYGHVKVYDRRKNAFERIIGTTNLTDYTGLDRCVASDMEGAVYIIGRSARLQRFDDTGKALVPTYHSQAAQPSITATFDGSTPSAAFIRDGLREADGSVLLVMLIVVCRTIVFNPIASLVDGNRHLGEVRPKSARAS